jgi:hypothetical protein
MLLSSFLGYCEENIGSMESLCNTIAGDAPLYTMFRKEASLVKCPFKGPFSFSYSKGGRGQVCEYPQSYMDTCADNKRMVLRYQACLDVDGSEAGSKYLNVLDRMPVVEDKLDLNERDMLEFIGLDRASASYTS